MALKLTYVGDTTVPVEIEGLTPDVVRDWSNTEIEQFEIQHGNRKIPLSDMFQISGDASDGRFEFEGDLAGVHWVGNGMASGEIHVNGNVGRHLGSEMSGGTITVDGDAGGWAGAEMSGGSIHVRGSAGHLIGAAYRGSEKGMTGGTILIDGDVGNEVGHTMRRGMLAIGGSCGDMPGFNMIAGSIFIFGNAGIRAGAGMRRGTIGFFGEAPPLLPTFKRGNRVDPVYLRVALTQLRKAGLKTEWAAPPEDLVLYHGDFLEEGRGEILVREGA